MSIFVRIPDRPGNHIGFTPSIIGGNEMFDVLWFIGYVCAVFAVILLASAVGLYVIHTVFSRFCEDSPAERLAHSLMEHQRKTE